jgi:hypothetical protein
MSLLTRDAILGADDRRTEDVEVPEWGGTVRVRALSGAERDAYEASLVQFRGDGTQKLTLANARARLVYLSACDEEGERLFTKEQDVNALGKKSASALQRVWEAASRLSGLKDEDVKKAAETFVDAPNDGSTSG